LATFDFSASVAKRKTAGGTASEAVKEQIQNANAWLKSFASVQNTQGRAGKMDESR
jgi:hypothetical protein